MIACSIGWARAAIIALALSGSAAMAQVQVQTHTPSPAAVTLARQVLEIKGATNVYDPALTGMVLRARSTLLQANPMLSADLDVVAQQVRKEMLPRVEALKQESAKIYASYFTERELKDLLAFYKSSLGTKFLTVEPKVLSETIQYADKWAAALGDEVLAKMRAEMRKKGHDL
jgi:hypothetical protein